MKKFIKAYTFTLTPTAMIVIIASIAYYTTQLSFNKAISIGTLNGFIIAGIINIIPAIITFRKIDKVSQTKPKKKQKRKKDITQKTNQSQQHSQISSNQNNQHKIYSLYLLLDKEKAFDLSINSIVNQSLGSILNKDHHRGIISARTAHQIINFNIQSLTRHTAKVEINAQQDNNTLKDILTYIKQKESSFITY